MWAEEELKVGTLSNGTVENYLGAIRCIKKHPIAERKLKTVTAEHLQAFLDLLTFGGKDFYRFYFFDGYILQILYCSAM